MEFCLATALSPIEHYLPLAQAAEEHGWHALSCSEHVVNPETTSSPYPYSRTGERRWKPFAPWPDPWVMIGAMATATTRLRFFTNVYVLPLRPPFGVAKTVGTAAVLSGNRVALGIGMGWMEDEFRLMEQRFDRRGRRADEMIEVLRKLWAGGWVEHHGEFYDFDRLEMSPAPTSSVPIYVGGLSDAALLRAARNDGWISDQHSTEELAEVRRRIDRYRADLGRSELPFAFIASSKDAVDYDGFRALEDVGVTHLLTMPWAYYSGFTADLSERVDAIKRFADDIIARF